MTTQKHSTSLGNAAPDEILSTLRITTKRSRYCGGTWVSGIIADHEFEALVFPMHAESESYELQQSRISKLWIRERGCAIEAACFDRGWDKEPTTEIAKQIVDLLAAGLAEHVFGK